MLKLCIFVTILGLCYSTNGNSLPYVGWVCVHPNYNANGTHSVFIGCVKPTDKLLYSRPVYKSGSLISMRQLVIRYPLPEYIRTETITGIWMVDYDRNGTGGFGKVLSGGVGYRNVTIELRSYRWGRGFNFLIQIYGS